MTGNSFTTTGLTDSQVLDARKKYGLNKVEQKKDYGTLRSIAGVAKEPMIILLLLASFIYFLTGNIGDGIFMSVAIVLVAAISLHQDSRSRHALEKLKDYTQPVCKVMRNGILTEVKSEELVIGDSLVAEEGTLINADARIIHSNDFSVNESILTGEFMPVEKNKDADDHFIYQGTSVASGLAIATVTKTGPGTRLNAIGKSMDTVEEEKTPLEIQINNFIRIMVYSGIVVFAIVWGINYSYSASFTDSLLKALTLAMSILPEEIPVAFTTFMALGSWRLMKMGIIVKQMKTVETLGSANVICTDKTGTITENKMSLAAVSVFPAFKTVRSGELWGPGEKELIKTAMWASEPFPFDPMEIALHEAYENTAVSDERGYYKMIHEYPLNGKPPMMTHIYENSSGDRIITAKGAPEALAAVSQLTPGQILELNKAVKVLASEGYRILAVGNALFSGYEFPGKQQEFKFQLKGIIAFYDPPKHNIRSVFEGFYQAGISVKIVTGDNALTTASIARQVGFKEPDKCISGEELMRMDEGELNKKVRDINIFTRMFPEAKLRIINALKKNNAIVAMTGDGVNDGPALKAAHIGIAMGKKGSEIARQAASLILKEDDLSQMLDAIAMGRRIYSNLKKAIRYIISIHIPIILTVMLPLTLGWIYPNIFSPIHIIFLELLMGPTCSIIYENEPMEKNLMMQKPRLFTKTFFNRIELSTSILQGLVITTGVLTTYQYAVHLGLSEEGTRTMVFACLVSANIFLTLVNRSFHYSILTTLKYKNNLVSLVIAVTIGLCSLMFFARPVSLFFEFEFLKSSQLAIAVMTGCLSVTWYEIVKWRKRQRTAEI